MIQLSATDTDYQLTSATAQPATAVWGNAAIRLLQGVVYHDDNASLWETLRANVSPLTDYFAKIGLQLIIDEADAMAYLRQPDDEEQENDAHSVPRLFRRTQMTYEQTLLCVLLRDHMRIFEEEDVQNEKCVVLQSDLLAIWENFFPSQSDNVKLNRLLGTNLRRLEELKFVRQFENEPPSWEIRRIIKARLPLSELETLQQSLLAHIESGNKDDIASPDHHNSELDNS
jgi:Domain of unknown function (DUF4194)